MQEKKSGRSEENKKRLRGRLKINARGKDEKE